MVSWRYRTIDANHIREIILSLTIGCSIDLDHFIAAGSPSLFAATHLSERPFGHNIVFVLFLSFGIFFLLSKRLSLLFVSASFNHLSRDALRRGYTLSPWHSLHTTSIPYALYLGILVLLPLLLSSTLNKFPTFWNSSTGCCVKQCYITISSAKRTTCEEVWTWTKDPKLLFFVVWRHTLIRRFFHWDGHAGLAIFWKIFSHSIALICSADYIKVQQLCRRSNGRKEGRSSYQHEIYFRTLYRGQRITIFREMKPIIIEFITHLDLGLLHWNVLSRSLTGALIHRKLMVFCCHMSIKYYLLSSPISLDFIIWGVSQILELKQERQHWPKTKHAHDFWGQIGFPNIRRRAFCTELCQGGAGTHFC